MGTSSKKRLCFAALLLVGMLAFQSVGWLLAWKGLQLGAQFEAQRVLFQGENTLNIGAGGDSNRFQQSFHKDFIEKIKVVGKKEFVLDGKLFDYRILAETEDSIKLSLYHDHHEQALLSALGQAFKSSQQTNGPSSAPVALWLAKWLGSAFMLPEKLEISINATSGFQKQTFISLLFAAQSAPSIFAPPPELVA